MGPECNAEPFENPVSSMRIAHPGIKYTELLAEVYLFERWPFDLLPIIMLALLEFGQLKYKEVSNLSYETEALPIPSNKREDVASGPQANPPRFDQISKFERAREKPVQDPVF